MQNGTDIICYNINEIHLINDLNPYRMRYITGVIEYDNEVVVKHCTKIVGLERGWFGNLNCNTRESMDIDMNETENINPIHCIKDVVLKEIQIDNEGIDSATYFNYVFKKI